MIDRPEQETDILALQVYPNTVKFVKRHKEMDRAPHIKEKGTYVKSFSAASRRRLMHIVQNVRKPLVSQFCLTYHTFLPKKEQLKAIRKKFFDLFRHRYGSSVDYLWILEFQSRGFPHYHVFFSCQPNEEMHNWMAKTWNRITGEGSEHLAFHQHEKNFIDWDMGTGQYTTKYLDKAAQKSVPDGYFDGAGRFWGHSKGIVDLPQIVVAEELIESIPIHIIPDPIAYIARAVDNFKGRVYKQYGRKSRIRQALCSWTVPMCAGIVRRILDYFNTLVNATAEATDFDYGENKFSLWGL